MWPRTPTGVLATLSLVSALFAASCWVLPRVLGLGAGGGLFSTFELLADYQARILVSSAFLISFGWIVYVRRQGARSTAVVLAFASLLVVMAAIVGR